MLLMIAGAMAQMGPEPLPTVVSDGKNHVLIDGERARLPRARRFLIADAGSRLQARKAKRTGLTASIVSIAGASVVLLGAVSVGSSENSTTGMGTILLGTGIALSGTIVSVQSQSKWRKAVPLYTQTPYVP